MEQAPENEVATTNIEIEKEEQATKQKEKKRKKNKDTKHKGHPVKDKRFDE
jgi:hypothetical protein